MHSFNKGKEINAKGYNDTIKIFSLSFGREGHENKQSPVISPRISNLNNRRPQSGRVKSSSETYFSITDHYIKLTEEIMAFLDIDKNMENENMNFETKEDSFPMKLVMIEGSTGIGKSHYLSFLSQELLKLSKYSNKVNKKKIGFEVLSSKAISLQVSSPFQIWRPIIMSILKKPGKAMSNVEMVRKLRNTSSDGLNSDELSIASSGKIIK